MLELTREQLHVLVWGSPVSIIAKRIGISDVAIAKTCTKVNVPVPPRGYWRRSEAVRAKLRLPLPLRSLGDRNSISFRDSSGGNSSRDDEILAWDPGPEPTFAESMTQVAERAAAIAKTGVKSDPMAHPLIARLLKDDDSRVAQWEKDRLRSLWAAEPHFVSPFERRRLKAIGGLLHRADRVGSSYRTTAKDPSEFKIKIGSQHIRFSVEHPGQLRNGFSPVSEWNRPASTVMTLFSPDKDFEFTDLPGLPLERQLEQIFCRLLIRAEEQARSAEISHHRWILAQKTYILERRAQQALARSEAAEKASSEIAAAQLAELTSLAKRLDQAKQIRELVERVGQSDIGRSNPRFASWSARALSVADDLDPLLGAMSWLDMFAAEPAPIDEGEDDGDSGAFSLPPLDRRD